MLRSANDTMQGPSLAEQRLLAEALVAVERWLPTGWSVVTRRRFRGPAPAHDGIWEFLAPDGQRARFLVEARRTLEPRAAALLVESLRPDTSWLVVARYLGAATRAKLAAARVSYFDLSGNVYISSAAPGLLLRADGAAKDPERTERAAASLRGARAAWIVRDLIERERPGTLRDIAARTGSDVGYVSRVLTFLDGQALVTRSRRGELTDVAWRLLLERWATDAPLRSRGQASLYLAPRGLDELVRRLPAATDYAVTSSLAAAQVAPIAPARLATIYVANARTFATAMKLRSADAGANVALIEVEHELALMPGARPDWHGHDDRVAYASPINVAADLLTGRGREPEEGEALLTWMQEHVEVWRA